MTNIKALNEAKTLDAVLVQFQNAIAQKRNITVKLKQGHLLYDTAEGTLEAGMNREQVTYEVRPLPENHSVAGSGVRLTASVVRIRGNGNSTYIQLFKENDRGMYGPQKSHIILPYSSIDQVFYKK